MPIVSRGLFFTHNFCSTLWINKVQIAAKSADFQNMHPALHVIHPFHHNMSTKTPRSATIFSKNPRKNPTPPRTKKCRKK
jgi:hypothetical protein